MPTTPIRHRWLVVARTMLNGGHNGAELAHAEWARAERAVFMCNGTLAVTIVQPRANQSYNKTQKRPLTTR